MKKSAVWLVLLSALAACNSNSDPVSAPTTPATPASVPTAPAPAPTPTVWTKQEMAAAYVAIQDDLSPLVDKLNGLIENDGTVAEFNEVCADLSTASFEGMQKVSLGEWSDSVRPLMNDWMKAVSELRTYFDLCSTATTVAAVQEALSPLQTSNAHDEASLIKIALGLPQD
jgi:hypothetical protein